MKAGAPGDLTTTEVVLFTPAPAPAPKPASTLIPQNTYGGFPVLIAGVPGAPAPAPATGGCAGGGCPMMQPPPGGATTVTRYDGAGPAASGVATATGTSWETLPWWVWLLVGLVLVALVTR